MCCIGRKRPDRPRGVAWKYVYRGRGNGPWWRSRRDAHRSPFGSDQFFEGAGQARPERRSRIIVNLQGDFPTITDNIRSVLARWPTPGDILAAAEIHTAEESSNPNVMKAVGSVVIPGRLRALFHPRQRAPGRRAALSHRPLCLSPRRAGVLSPCPPRRWKARKLEQLRALEPACG
jgi:3-deoxy-manno-octulosonate cytidylyltransferase (CMP-KDO synthetase)